MKDEKIGEGGAGEKYGHVPGHQYDDVDVTIYLLGAGGYRVDVAHTAGSAQGYDEEHERTEVSGWGDDIAAAVAEAKDNAIAAGIEQEHLIPALCKARREAEEKSTAAP